MVILMVGRNPNFSLSKDISKPTMADEEKDELEAKEYALKAAEIWEGYAID